MKVPQNSPKFGNSKPAVKYSGLYLADSYEKTNLQWDQYISELWHFTINGSKFKD
jgi:hypothetical protein